MLYITQITMVLCYLSEILLLSPKGAKGNCRDRHNYGHACLWITWEFFLFLGALVSSGTSPIIHNEKSWGWSLPESHSLCPQISLSTFWCGFPKLIYTLLSNGGTSQFLLCQPYDNEHFLWLFLNVETHSDCFRGKPSLKKYWVNLLLGNETAAQCYRHVGRPGFNPLSIYIGLTCWRATSTLTNGFFSKRQRHTIIFCTVDLQLFGKVLLIDKGKNTIFCSSNLDLSMHKTHKIL